MNNKRSDNIITAPGLPMPKIKGVGITFFEKMLEHKDKIAHTDAETDKTETYQEVLQKTIRASLAMLSHGIKPKDRITICSDATPESFTTFYASFFIGAISANIHPKLTLPDVVALLDLVKPKIIFVISTAIELIETAVKQSGINTRIVVYGDTSKHMKYSEFLKSSQKENEFVPYQPASLKDTAVVVFSSGSTGVPKGVCLSHYGLIGLVYQLKVVPVYSAPILLTFASLQWITAVAVTSNCMIHGINRIICSHFDRNKIWDIIKKYKVSGLFLNSFCTLELCKYGRPENADTSTLSAVLYGGSPTTVEQNIHIRKCLPEAIALNTFGQSEATGCVLSFHPSNTDHLKFLKKYPTSVGTALPGCSYKVVNPETEETLGPNQEGELRIKSDFLMNGYYKLDDSDAWDSDGFLKTGDVAYYNEDECFFIVDRIKDVLKYQTWHISPAKIEAVILRHPGVQHCVVIGIPDEVDIDHLMGVVVLKDSAIGKVSEEDIQKYVDDQVGFYEKLRAGVKFVNELPSTATNKISRLLTKRLVLEGKI